MDNTTLIVAIVGGAFALAASITAGVAAYINRKPDRMESITDGAWRLKEDAEKQLSGALVRIGVLEVTVRDNAGRLEAAETKHAAAMLARQTVHDAEMKALHVLHDAETIQKDRIIVRLTEKVDELERRLDALSPPAVAPSAPVRTITSTESTTTIVPATP